MVVVQKEYSQWDTLYSTLCIIRIVKDIETQNVGVIHLICPDQQSKYGQMTSEILSSPINRKTGETLLLLTYMNRQ